MGYHLLYNLLGKSIFFFTINFIFTKINSFSSHSLQLATSNIIANLIIKIRFITDMFFFKFTGVAYPEHRDNGNNLNTKFVRMSQLTLRENSHT